MLRIILNYKGRVAFLLVLILLIFLLLPELKRKPAPLIGRPLLVLTAQIQKGISYIFGGFGSAMERIKNISELEVENKSLLLEVERLREENRRLQEMGLLNEKLREMLGFKKSLSLKTVATHVIGRDPTNWYKTIMIDRGESDGVTKDMGVIVPSGVVGRVIKSVPNFSQVLLITDINSATAVLIERTRNEGILEGRSSSPARIKYIPLLADTKVGDLVVTSGLAGGFPKDLVVGRISRTEKRPSELFQDVEMIPAVDFNRIEEAFVITSLNAE